MHVDLDAFFVSAERVDKPELAARPVVVGGNPGARGVVAAASYEARKFGIHSGMPLKTAVRLCPEAVFIAGNHEKYRSISKKFVHILHQYSPFIEVVGIDEAFLDATGFESIYVTHKAMAQKLRLQILCELGITASIGIANSKIVAKVASEAAKPDGLLEVPAGSEAGFLNHLAISKLPGIGKRTEAVLKGMGVSVLGELARLPRGSLKHKLGSYGQVLIDYANGIDPRPVEPPHQARSISREVTFTRDTHDRKVLLATLKRLSEQIGTSLRHSSRQARCITLKLRFSDFSTITRSKTLPAGTDADQIIFDTGSKLLIKELSASPLAIRLTGIGVSSITEIGRQLDMLDSENTKQASLSQAIDRIRDKYGFSSIQTGMTISLDEMLNSPGKSA